jgi:hypothetical protein
MGKFLKLGNSKFMLRKKLFQILLFLVPPNPKPQIIPPLPPPHFPTLGPLMPIGTLGHYTPHLSRLSVAGGSTVKNKIKILLTYSFYSIAIKEEST